MNRIKFVFIALILATSINADAQTVRDLWNSVKKNTSGGSNTTGTSLNNISNQEIVSALREALQVGAKNASGKLSAQNGYFGNQLVKILLPPEAKKVENALRQVGMNDLVDKTILSMNRAAEDAAVKAAPIFINAITTMSIQDGVNIVKGGNGAATNYLKSRTTAELTNAFRPVIQNSLNKLNVASYWNQLFTFYNRLPTTFNKINPDLTAYVTERALSGLFVTISEEENKIRTNPTARVTDLLKKVFGAK
ncbi:MAG TPA: DUF4197 domain-containing protein [Flavipsychrobacter sp.]|nr:DUF4197 domain-containing protein [Flavipsychrobacter sp.]